MVAPRYKAGDVVLTRIDIYNDGGVPDADAGVLLARAGTRAVIVRVGVARRGQRMYLVRFEGLDKTLGPTVGCLEDELTQDPTDCESGLS
jgi:nitrogen fixation protein NifZ